MGGLLKRYCCLVLIVCSTLHFTSANICLNMTSHDYNLEPYLHKNLYPDSRLEDSSDFYQIAEAKKIVTCCQECCKDDNCRSVFFREDKCFLVRCSVTGNGPKICPYGIIAVERNNSSNWTWVSVRELLNVTIEKHVPANTFTSLSNMTNPSSKLNETEDADQMTRQVLTSLPSLAPATFDHISTMQPPTTTTTARLWVVSAGKSRVTHMPNNNLTLYASIAPEPLEEDKGLYSYQWVMVSSPSSIGLGHMDDMSSPSLKLSMLHEGNYTLKVIVTKGDQSNEACVNVTVLPVVKKNTPPTAKIVPSDQKLNQQNDLILDGSESIDNDKIVSYKWELISGPATGAFPSDTSFNSSVFKLHGPLAPGLYNFRLTVVDSNGASNYTEATVEVIKEIDYPPKANAGSNQIIQLPLNNVTLMGNASFDDKGIVSYEWTKVTSDLVNDMTGARTPFLQLSNLQEGDYTFTLTVTDASNQMDKAEVHVIVKPAKNHPPRANAGANQTLFLPLVSVDLDASNSTDDNKVVSYHWKVLDGPDNPRIENDDQSNAKLLNPSVGIYMLQVKVADEMGLESSANVYITIKQNQNAPPVSKAGSNMEVELNQGDVIIINGSSSYDDKGISKFLWLRDNKSPAAGIAIKNSDHTPVLQLVDLVKGQYLWTLEVTDVEGLSDKSQMTLTVKGDSKEDYLVRLVLGVDAEMFTGLYKDALQSHLEDLVKKGLEAPESRVTLRRLGQDPVTGRTVIDFYAESRDKGLWTLQGSDEVENILKFELITDFSNILEFPIVDIFAVVCHRNCSGHGKCNQVTRKCTCDTFWTANWFKANFGSRETNCDWSVLYVVIVVTLTIVIATFLLWYIIYAIKRRIKGKCQTARSQGPIKKRHRYTLLDETSNGIKTNGDASHYADKGLKSHKVLDDLSDSGSSSEDMIFLRPSNEHQLRTIHRKKCNVGKKLLQEVGVLSTPDTKEQEWPGSSQKDVIGQFS